MSRAENARVERLLSAEEVSDILGIPLQSLYRLRVSRRGPAAVRVGRNLRFTPQSVRDWVSSQTEVR